MAVTKPRFLYGFDVGASTYAIPFERAGNNFDAEIPYGDYCPAELAEAAEDAMNEADPGQTYTCVFSFSTRIFTFDNGATSFKLEWSRLTSTNAAGLFGFAESDTADDANAKTGSAVGAGDSTAFTWAPTEPVAETTPVTAAADGTAATLLQHAFYNHQNRADGGRIVTVHDSIDMVLRLRFRWLSGDERANFLAFLRWAGKGKRFNYQPDATSDNALRLVMRNPGEVATVFAWLTRTEMDAPELTFVEQLSRAG